MADHCENTLVLESRHWYAPVVPPEGLETEKRDFAPETKSLFFRVQKHGSKCVAHLTTTVLPPQLLVFGRSRAGRAAPTYGAPYIFDFLGRIFRLYEFFVFKHTVGVRKMR